MKLEICKIENYSINTNPYLCLCHFVNDSDWDNTVSWIVWYWPANLGEIESFLINQKNFVKLKFYSKYVLTQCDKGSM